MAEFKVCLLEHIGVKDAAALPVDDTAAIEKALDKYTPRDKAECLEALCEQLQLEPLALASSYRTIILLCRQGACIKYCAILSKGDGLDEQRKGALDIVHSMMETRYWVGPTNEYGTSVRRRDEVYWYPGAKVACKDHRESLAGEIG